MEKTVIVVGATGLIGQRLVSHLTRNEQVGKVVAITRRSVVYEHDKVVNLVVDFAELEHYRSVFHGDILFSCLGTTVKQAGSIGKQRIVDVDYQYKAAQLAAEGEVSRYVLVSSSGANRYSRNAFLKMKGELEHLVQQLPFERVNIMQPSLLLGERNHRRLGESFGAIVLPWVCKLPFLSRYRPISADTVAKKMVQVGLSPSASRLHYTLDEIFD